MYVEKHQQHAKAWLHLIMGNIEHYLCEVWHFLFIFCLMSFLVSVEGKSSTFFFLMSNIICILSFWVCLCLFNNLTWGTFFCRMFVRSAQKSCQIMKRRSKTSLKSIFTLMRRSAIVLLEVVWANFLLCSDFLVTSSALLSC